MPHDMSEHFKCGKPTRWAQAISSSQSRSLNFEGAGSSKELVSGCSFAKKALHERWLRITLWFMSLVFRLSSLPSLLMYMFSIDQILKFARPSRSILFYKTEKDPVEAVDSLKRGLASALVAFYPMAGRLVDDGGRFALDCNDEGIEFVEAKCELSFADLEQDGFHIRRLFRGLVGMDCRRYSDHIEDPIVSVQVTSFVGGFTVGFAITHSVADGHSSWTFVRSVAEACRGKPLSVLPVHTRSVLKPESLLLNRFPEMPSEELARKDAAPSCNASMEVSGGSPIHKLMLIQGEELHQKIINFNKDMLETLKKACCEGQSGFFTSFEALSAYLWKRLVMAQALADCVRVGFRVPLDVRSRMIPPLTPAFFGNAVVGLTVTTTAGELKAESIGATAARIRQGVRQGDASFIRKAIINREKLDLRDLSLGVVLCNIRNASRFPVFEAGDFGWGQPEAVRPSWGWIEGEMTWYPGRKADSIDVIVSLTSSTFINFISQDLYSNDLLILHYPNDPLDFPS